MTFSDKYRKLTKWWLTALLAFMPFQHAVVRINGIFDTGVEGILNRLDEITILVFFPLAMIEYYMTREIFKRHFLALLISVLLLGVYGLISGMVNGNSHISAIQGTFDYIKYFLVIFIYAAFFGEEDDFKKIFKLSLIIGVSMGVFAFIQEMWAVGSRYILNKHIDDIFYLEISQLDRYKDGISAAKSAMWRYGIMRASSLMDSANHLGFYCLLILAIYSSTVKNKSKMILLSLITGIAGSLSRTIYICFMFILGFQIMKGRKRFIVVIIPLMLVMTILAAKHDFNFRELIESVDMMTLSPKLEGEKRKVITYRSHMREKAIEIWKDNVIWGVGPAMFGGLAVKYNSPVIEYERYHVLPIFVHYLKQWGTLDQFWPQVLAELGTVGFAIFVWIFVSWFTMLYVFRNKAPSDDAKKIFDGLIIFYVIILIYTFTFSLNMTPVIYSYNALVGIASGYAVRSSRLV